MIPEKSTHKVEVVRVDRVDVHPNADRLEVVPVYGYSCCVGKGEFKPRDLAIYLPPDSVVPQDDRFKFVWESKGYAPSQITSDVERIPERYRRVKAKVLRGVVSEGLLLPLAPFLPDLQAYAKNTEAEGVFPQLGDNVASILGITHYEPVEVSLDGDCDVAPIRTKKHSRGYPRTLRGWYRFIKSKLFPKTSIYGMEESIHIPIPSYDVDAWQRHKHLLEEGEPVWVTEKIHGSNFRAVHTVGGEVSEGLTGPGYKVPGRMYVGSHYQWKKNVPGSAFWEALKQNPWIESFCKTYPGYVLYGELVPTQRKLTYGQLPGKYRVFGFDVLDTNQIPHKWLSVEELDALTWRQLLIVGEEAPEEIGILHEEHWVPTIYIGSYEEATIREKASGPSTVFGAKHLREGIIIKPWTERRDPRFGRVILKIVSPEYLASKQSDE